MMRLFLDAHISARAVASALRKRNFDVRAADEERALDGWGDEDLLELATAENRVFVTFNVRDFPRIARKWAGSGKKHCGCICFVGLDHGEFSSIIELLEEESKARPKQAQWVDYFLFVSKNRETEL